MSANRRPTPEPLETNDVLVVTIGTVAWAIALVALLVWQPEAAGRDRWVWIAAAGFGLGLIGVRYVRKRQRARPTTPPDQPAPPDPAPDPGK